MNTMPFASLKTEAITFPADDTTSAFFGGEKMGVSAAWIVVWSLARNGGPNTHFGWGNVQENWLDLLEKVPSRPTTGPAW